jgi:hypothetical protein
MVARPDCRHDTISDLGGQGVIVAGTVDGTVGNFREYRLRQSWSS